MSHKNCDKENRWRSKTIAFRVSPEENDEINRIVSTLGIPKQEYLTANMLHHEIRIVPNPRLRKALMVQLNNIFTELKQIEQRGEISTETAELLRFIASIINDL